MSIRWSRRIVLRSFFAALGCATLLTANGLSARANGVFIGQDHDYHASRPYYNPTGAQRIIQKAIRYLTDNLANPRILLVTDLRDPMGAVPDTHDFWRFWKTAYSSDPRDGMVVSGYPTFDVGTAVSTYPPGFVFPPNAVELLTVNFNAYDVVVVASDFGGWLRQEELDVLNARAGSLLSFINSGGSLVVLVESGTRPTVIPPPELGYVPPFWWGPWYPAYPGTSHDRYGFLPFSLGPVPTDHREDNGMMLSPAGVAMGLTFADITKNFFHSIFTSTGGLDIVDMHMGRIVSLVHKGNIP